MALRDGMWAVLFTDLVGSTAQRARLGDEAGDALRREHDAVVVRVLASHRGELVSDTGDGAMCVFASAADAIAAGVAVQQGIERRNRRSEEPLGLRVGVSAGELVVEGDGLMGLAAHEAARICALCEAGEVLVSDLVRLMAGSRTDARLAERGAFDVKGIPTPVTVWQVVWESKEEDTLPLPTRLVSPGAWAFSSRDDELAVLRGLWSNASAGARRAVFVSGEPGIGKTRLAAELANLARGEGALVLYGQCDDELGTPFLPFAEALDWYLEHASDVVAGHYPGDLSRLSERVRERVPNAPEPLAADAETEQHRLFDAVVSWLGELADAKPLVLVLDDLHWATKPTLLMLRHLLRGSDQARILVIATYRDTDLDRQHPLGGMLADFRRLAGVERVSLSGLDEAGVVEFVHNVAEQEVDERLRQLAGALVDETEGNPFFLGEVLRHLVESGAIVRADGRWSSERSVDELGLPEGVREVVGQRLDRLSEAANALLTTASLVGREFTVAVLSEVGGQSADEALELLDEAVGAQIIEEIALDRFRFSHALVRATLRDELGSSRRFRLHRRIAEALEKVDPGNDIALAHHWMEAAGTGDPGRAIEYATRAAQAAVVAGAYDDAADLYRRALELCEGGDLEEQRRGLLLDLAEALSLGGASDALAPVIDVVEASRAADDVQHLVQGASMLGWSFQGSDGVVPPVLGGVSDEHMIALLTDALTRTGAEMPRERARLLMGLASQMLFESWDRRVALAEEALALARGCDDPDVFVNVGQRYLHVLSTPENLERRLAIADELQEVAPSLTNAVSRWNAYSVQPAWEAGLLDWVEHRDAEGEAALEGVPYPYGHQTNLVHRAKRALFEGRVEDAEHYADDIITRFGDRQDAVGAYAALIGASRCEQGRASEIVELVEQIRSQVEGGGAEPLVRAFHAFLVLQAGDVEAAATMLGAEADMRFAEQGQDMGWYAYHAHWAEVAAELGDRDAAEQLRARLAPYADRIANFVFVAYGLVARHVGRLENLLGDYPGAEQHLARAAARHQEWGAALYLARTWADQAELLLARDGEDALAPATDLLDKVRAVARDCHAPGVDEYADRVRARARGGGLVV